MRTTRRRPVRWHRILRVSAAALLCTAVFPVSAGAVASTAANDGEQQSIEFVVGICAGPEAVVGNFEADLKPTAGSDPSALKQPWLAEDGPPVSGRLPAGCKPAGAGFTLEVARDTQHYTGRSALITGDDGRSTAALSSLPHADRLARGEDVWAQPISPNPNRYQPIAFRCGNDARNGDLTEYVSGRDQGRQYCVAFYTEAAQPADPSGPTAPTTSTTSTSAPAATTSPVAPTTGTVTTTTAATNPAPAPVTTTAVPVTGPSSRPPGTAPVTVTQPSASLDDAESNGTNASPSTDVLDADPADLRPRTAAVPVTRPPSTTPTTSRPTGADTGAIGADTGSTGGDATNAPSLSRPESGASTNGGDRAESGGNAGDDRAQQPTDDEVALGRKAADRAVDLILAIEVRGLTRESEATSVTPWTDTVRAEVRCGDGPARTLTLEPGEEPGFTLSLGVKFLAAEATECTHRLLTDGLEDESLGGVLASVDGKSTRRGEAQTVVLHPDDPARTFQYELVYVNAEERSKLVAAGDDLSRGADPAESDSSGEDTAFSGERPVDRGLGRTGERIPAPTLVALGMIFVVGLALSIAQSSKAV